MVAIKFILFILLVHCYLGRISTKGLTRKYVADVTTPTFHVECGGGSDNFYFVNFVISLQSRSNNFEWCKCHTYFADVTTPTFDVECGGGCDKIYFVYFASSLLSRANIYEGFNSQICSGFNHPDIPRGIWGWLR